MIKKKFSNYNRLIIDKLEKILSHITGHHQNNYNNKMKVPDMTSSNNNYLNQIIFDEEKLLNAMIDQSMITSKIKWMNFRKECIQHMSSSSNIEFFEKFISLIYKIDPVYHAENEEFLNFLYHFMSWKSNEFRNIDMIINRLSSLYEKSLLENNETLNNQMAFLTYRLLEDVIDKHGSGVIVKIRKSFEKICKKTQDHEMLYILWRKLFER